MLLVTGVIIIKVLRFYSVFFVCARSSTFIFWFSVMQIKLQRENDNPVHLASWLELFYFSFCVRCGNSIIWIHRGIARHNFYDIDEVVFWIQILFVVMQMWFTYWIILCEHQEFRCTFHLFNRSKSFLMIKVI